MKGYPFVEVLLFVDLAAQIEINFLEQYLHFTARFYGSSADNLAFSNCNSTRKCSFVISIQAISLFIFGKILYRYICKHENL